MGSASIECLFDRRSYETRKTRTRHRFRVRLGLRLGSKTEAANASRSDDSGFAKLDKNKDGYISKAEAKGNAELAKNFAKWDMNNDGRVNRGEYLAAMAKVDATKVKDKVADKIEDAKDKREQRDASTGATRPAK
jgi:Ca2+-binding EF-hand superfamily protein